MRDFKTNEQLARADLAEIVSLGLEDSEITDAGLEVLKKWPNIRTVYLHGSLVTPEGRRAIERHNPRIDCWGGYIRPKARLPIENDTYLNPKLGTR